MTRTYHETDMTGFCNVLHNSNSYQVKNEVIRLCNWPHTCVTGVITPIGGVTTLPVTGHL